MNFAAWASVITLLPALTLPIQESREAKQYVIASIDCAACAGLTPAEQKNLHKAVIGTRFSASHPQDAADRVRNAIQNLGFFTAVVRDPVVEVIDPQDPTRVRLRFIDVTIGGRYRLRQLNWVGIKAFSASRLDAVFLLHPGDIFGVSKVRQGLEVVKRLYGTDGYINMVCTPDTEVHKEDQTIALTFNVEEGIQFRISVIRLLGLRTMPASELVDALPIKYGDVFDESKVAPAIEKMKSLYAAKGNPNVTIEATVQPMNEPGTVSLIFTVNEGPLLKQ